MIDARPNVLRRSACARSAVLAYLEISGSELAALARISAEEIETFYDEAMSGRPRAASNLREMGDAGAALNTACTIAQELPLQSPGERPATASNVQAVRRKLGLSQREFALRFGFSLATVRNWEQGHRAPDGSERALLTIIDREPAAVERA